MIITTFPWTTEEAASKLSEMYDEEGFGYFSMFSNLILNNWPSQELNHYLHILICLGGERFRMHVAMGDYGGSPKAKRNYLLVPFDLLSETERQRITHGQFP